MALELNDHLEDFHEKPSKKFCYICDRRVSDLNRHLDEYFSIHQDKLVSMAPCIHPEDAENSSEFENECKKCHENYVPDPRLPDWMSRASCQKCLKWCLKNDDSVTSKVILCSYCRQGKFGFTKKSQNFEISMCISCLKMAQSYHKMTDALQCSSYVTGMLNELVSFIYFKDCY